MLGVHLAERSEIWVSQPAGKMCFVNRCLACSLLLSSAARLAIAAQQARHEDCENK